MKSNDDFPCLLKEVDGVKYLLSDCADMINNHLKKGDKWEPLTLYLSELLLEGVNNPVVIDVGANLGAYCIPVAKKIAPYGGRVYAYEAQRLVYYQCCANVFLNNLTNCYINHLAIGDRQSDVEIPRLDMRTSCNTGALSLDPVIRAQQNICQTGDATEPVRMTSLDSLTLPETHLIKVDVEGLEYEVLSGAKNLLAASEYPPILFETWGDYMPCVQQKQRDLLTMLEKEAGYEITSMGELALAEHPLRKKLNIIVSNGGLSVLPLAKQG